MNISTKRFNIRSDGFGGVTVRDRDAPYHPHHLNRSDLPGDTALAQMTEAEFDSRIVTAVYGGNDD